MTDFKMLQNGVDIVGSVADGAGDGDTVITRGVAGQIAGAFVYWLSQKVQKNPVMLKLCVGTDTRTSGTELKEGVLEGISIWGAEGFDAGIATTPAMMLAPVMPQFEFDGAVMITAGGMPYDMNGFKFFTSAGAPCEEDTAEILRLASRYNFIGGTYEELHTNLMQIYAAQLRQMLSQGLKDLPGYAKGLKVITDKADSAGRFFAESVLGPMGADISASMDLYNEAGSTDYLPGRDDPETAFAICKAVKESEADLGILFNSDGSAFTAASADGILFARSTVVGDVCDPMSDIEHRAIRCVVDAANKKTVS